MKLSDIRLKRRENQSELPAEENQKTSTAKKTKGEQTPGRFMGDGRIYRLPAENQMLPSLVTLLRIVLAIVLILVTVLVKSLPDIAVLLFRIAAAVCAGYEVLYETVLSIQRKAFTFEGFPVEFAVLLAFLNGMSLEAAITMTLFQIALCLRNYAYLGTKGMILAEIALPETSAVLAVGDSFMFESGQTSPADCFVAQGTITVDMSFVSGERNECALKAGDSFPAGSVCVSGSALVEVTALADTSAAYALNKAIAGGFSAPTKTEEKISGYARLLIPALPAISLLLLIILPLFTDLGFSESLRRAITIIAIASPCGIMLILPLIYLATMAERRRQGAAFLSANAVDVAADVGTVVFEKLGTVSTDAFSVGTIDSEKMDQVTFMKVAAHAVSGSSNPMARAIENAYGAPLSSELIADFKEYPGWGVSGTVDGIKILLGTGTFIERNQISAPRSSEGDCVLFMTVNGILAGRITLRDGLNYSVKDAIAELAHNGVDRIAMVSGDSRERDGAIAKELGISEYYAECSGKDKARNIMDIRAKSDEKSAIAYICAPSGSGEASAAADLCMVVNSTDVKALDGSADVLFLGSSLSAAPKALLAAKRARRLIYGGVLIGLAMKLIITVLAACGFMPLWFGFLLDFCVSTGLIIACASVSKPRQ